MAMHPATSAIAPEMSGLGIANNTAHIYTPLNAYARSVGKGTDKVPIPYTALERQMLDETLAGGYFNEPLFQAISPTLLASYPELSSLTPRDSQQFLWERYCALPSARRVDLVKAAFGSDSVSIVEVEALSSLFGQHISHDAHTLPHPRPADACASLHAPALMITGWYDWGLNDALASWQALQREASEPVRSRSRLIITPSAHSKPGYHEGAADHPELNRAYRTESNVALLLSWYDAVRERTVDNWPRVIYYLMGAHEWRSVSEWPPPEAHQMFLHLHPNGTLSNEPPASRLQPDRYIYDPTDPTPTVGGSILSSVYAAGSVDVSEVQKCTDVLSYTTKPLEADLDVAGPLRLILYASSSAVDTDFVARLSDVFPDGRAIQLQNGILRARYRDLHRGPELLEPGRIYRFEIDLWATANRFKAGHSLRLDISSADFPRFDRNSNRGGAAGAPLPAVQTIYHDADSPSHLILSVIGNVILP
jgi:putative CocE/NonD family hydrolase